MTRKLFWISILMLIALLAAGCGGKQAEATEAAAEPTQSSDQAAAPTELAADAGTETEAQEPAATWGDLQFVTGNAKRTTVEDQGGAVVFTLKDANTYAYRFQEGADYDDVTVEVDTTNLGDNDNGIALICRASDAGWYEYRVTSGGMYSVFLYDAALKGSGTNPYRTLDSGGSGLLTGKQSSLKFVCEGNTLRIYANGEEIEPRNGTIEDKNNTFASGEVGIGAMSNARTPVKISFDTISISE
ncbi:MAG TPA: hypothetical protein VIO36_00200 [Anaerolineaceae bacterium]